MSKATLNLKLDSELKYDFAERCKQEGRSVSLVLRELMKAYLNSDYDETFYARIDEALQSPISNMSEDELFARLRS